MRLIFTILFLAAALQIFSQPTIDSSWIPTTGISYQFTYFNQQSTTISSGNPGPNQVWNLATSDTNSSIIYSYVDPSPVGGDSAVPGAYNALFTSYTGFYDFDGFNGSAYQALGVSNGTYDVQIDSIPMDIYHFPMQYDDSFANDYVYINYGSGYTPYSRVTGHKTVVVDGYGTLTTNSGTFYNVLRIHTHDMEIGIAYSGTSRPDSTIYDEYDWLSSAYKGLTLATTQYYYGSGTNINGGYTDINPSGIRNLDDAGISWSIFPVPATTYADIKINNTVGVQNVLVSVNDMTGRCLQSNKLQLSPGNQNVRLNISDIATGVYTVSLILGDISDVKKLVIKNQ